MSKSPGAAIFPPTPTERPLPAPPDMPPRSPEFGAATGEAPHDAGGLMPPIRQGVNIRDRSRLRGVSGPNERESRARRWGKERPRRRGCNGASPIVRLRHVSQTKRTPVLQRRLCRLHAPPAFHAALASKGRTIP